MQNAFSQLMRFLVGFDIFSQGQWRGHVLYLNSFSKPKFDVADNNLFQLVKNGKFLNLKTRKQNSK